MPKPLIDRTYIPITVLLTLLGLVLRVRAAYGDLWLDEAWSPWLVSTIHSLWDVFRALPDTNNHYLNSLWMYAVGPDAGAFVYRLPAVLLGTASIPAAGWAMRRDGRAAALAAMVLVSASYLMVEYGSQARGYSGFIFFEFLAIGSARELAAADDGLIQLRAAWKLGLSLGLGFLNLFLTAIVGAAIWLWLAWVLRPQTGWKPGLKRFAVVILPTLLCVAPTAACLVLDAGKMKFTNPMPFDPLGYWQTYGTALLLLLGVPVIVPSMSLFMLGIVGCNLNFGGKWRGERALFIILLILLPVLAWLARLPSSNTIRYFMPCLVGFILVLAGRFGHAVRSSEHHRTLALLGMLAAILLNASLLDTFFKTGRGDYTDLMLRVTDKGTVVYGTNHPRGVNSLLWYYGRRLSFTSREVPQSQWCKAPPGWLFLTDLAAVKPEAIAEGLRRDCHLFLTDVPFPTATVSTPGWHVYHIRTTR